MTEDMRTYGHMTDAQVQRAADNELLLRAILSHQITMDSHRIVTPNYDAFRVYFMDGSHMLCEIRDGLPLMCDPFRDALKAALGETT